MKWQLRRILKHLRETITLAAINVSLEASAYLQLRVYDVEKCYGTPLAVPVSEFIKKRGIPRGFPRHVIAADSEFSAAAG